ncbi:MAG TPA: hypothetical protein VIT65_27575 [Microlunatus sp.]
MVLSFSDGVDVEGELLTGQQTGELALAVPAYRTATGHLVSAAVWTVSETQTNSERDQLSIRLGQRLS